MYHFVSTLFILLVLGAWCAASVLRGRRRLSARWRAVVLGVAFLCAVDGLVIEPQWLEVTHVPIASARLARPVRVAVIADLQTDALGAYEERVLRTAMAEHPDVILFAGDYLQVRGEARMAAARAALRAIIRRVYLRAPLGVYAVQGNIDHEDWAETFAGTRVIPLAEKTPRDLGPLLLTGLPLASSFSPNTRMARTAKFHLVLGHGPDYSRGKIDADVLVSGHTHGGQVRVPFYGPILTATYVPRAQVGVDTRLADKTLVNSRGVGMERDLAPRVRFFCRPQLVVLELQPAAH